MLVKRRIITRPNVYAAALCCVAVGLVGLVLFFRNFSPMPIQDAETMPQSFWDAEHVKGHWAKVGGLMILIGGVGCILVKISSHVEQPKA